MGMTIEDCTKMLIAKEKCMERETSGIDTDCNLHNCDNCDLCYEQGTMGEQKEALKFAVDTMRKYQKIEDLVNDCADESVDDTSCCTRYIGLIEEVIYTGEQEDGND